MSFVRIILSFAVLQYGVSAAITTVQPKEGCTATKTSNIRCFWFNKKCDVGNDSPCTGSDICCPEVCGTSCVVPNYMEPNPVNGCPAIDTRINCFRFDEQCNDSDKQCPAGSICCSDYRCQSTCVAQKQEQDERCPPIDSSIQCVWFNEECNNSDKLCPATSICCGNNCGTSCIAVN